MGVLIANKVVGYQNIELPAAASSSATYWMFKTVTFKDVAGATDEQYFDITTILPKKADGSDWTTAIAAANNISSGQLVFQKITSDGAYTDRIQWTSRGAMTGWQTLPKDGSAAHVLAANEWTLEPGEGYILAYKKTVPCKLIFPSPIPAAE